MTTADEVFGEFRVALEFPSYFGRNWAAFDECLSDLSWLSADAYVLVIMNAHKLMRSEPAELAYLIETLDRVCTDWSHPIAIGESWDRTGKPFRTIFHDVPVHEAELPQAIAALPNILPLSS
jgi:hypothetical protein